MVRCRASAWCSEADVSVVALSRAREGMFILGNADQMSGRSSMWKKVIEELCESDSCGRGLPVACHQHPESVNYISEPGQLPSFAPDGTQHYLTYTVFSL